MTRHPHLRFRRGVPETGDGGHGGTEGVSRNRYIKEWLTHCQVGEEGEYCFFEGRAKVGGTEGVDDLHLLVFVKDARPCTDDWDGIH